MQHETTKREREIALMFFVKRPIGAQWEWVETGADAEECSVDPETQDLAVVLADYRKELSNP